MSNSKVEIGPDVSSGCVAAALGTRHSSKSRLVEPRHRLDGSSGPLRKLDSNSKVVEEFEIGTQTPRQSSTLFARNGRRPIIPAPRASYIASAHCYTASGLPILSFSTTWVVPSEPSTHSGLIFIWNGIVSPDGTWVLQPVLQWGDNDVSGGHYWQLVSFYASTESDFHHSSAVRVNPGDSVTGLVRQTAEQGGLFSYTSEFVGFPQTALSANNVGQLANCYEALEAYATRASDLPTREIQMRAIDVRTSAGSETVKWQQGASSLVDYGEHTFIRINGQQAEVDLYSYRLKQMAVLSVEGRLHVFYTNPADAIYYRRQELPNYTWADDESVGPGNSAKQLCPVVLSSGYVALLYVGTDDNIYVNEHTNLGWFGERKLGSQAKQIAAALNADGRLEVFYIGMDDNLYHFWEEFGGAISDHEALGGSAKSIEVASNADGRLELFYIGTNNVIYHNWQLVPNGNWSGEATFGTLAKQFAIGKNQNKTLELFYVTLDDQLYHNWQTAPNSGWNGIDNFGETYAQQVSVGNDLAGRQHLFYIDPNGQIYQMVQNDVNSAWGAPREFAGPASQVAVATNADGRVEVFYVGEQLALFQKWQTVPNLDVWSSMYKV
jgi:hypothetical protein